MKTLNLRHYNVKIVGYLFICIIIMQMLLPTSVIAAERKTSEYTPETKTVQNEQDSEPIVQKHVISYDCINETTILKPEIITTEQPIQKSLEEILANPNSKIIELIPYLQGSYEENVELLAHLMQGECRGGSDESMQYAGLIAIARSFDKQASDGTGNLESAIFMDGQYVCTWDGSFYQTPSEECYRNAEALLKQELLDPNAPITLFFMATKRFQGKTVYTTLEEGGKTVFIQCKW